MQYLEVDFSMEKAEAWQADLLIQTLGEIGFDSFQEAQAGFKAYVPEPSFNLVTLETALQNFPYPLSVSYEIREVPAENWNAHWEAHFPPLVLADQVYVRAPFHPARPELPWEVIIHPKMAFGTGHHQTTSLMLEYILEMAPSGFKVLDMGAGTGILSILCAKMGAKRVLAMDHDLVCFESILENSVLNGVERIERSLGSAGDIPEEKFNLILANINRNILLEHIKQYRAALDTNGILLLSGFYEDPDFEIIKTEATVNGLHYVNHKTRDQWVAAKFKL